MLKAKPRKKKQSGKLFFSRKAMSLRILLSSERRILSGIGGARSTNSESGRSKVETLDMLAIMGLLVVGGIMVYRYAVTKYQTNETFYELCRRAVVHSQQSMVGMP